MERTNDIYGYVRISTQRQSIERQIRNIRDIYTDVRIVKEVYTGRSMQRKEWLKLCRWVKPGDTIVFDSVSRMSRDAEEGCEWYEKFFEDDINLVFLKEPHINTDVYKEALRNQIHLRMDTGNKATDEFVNSIIDALNKYTIELAKAQIKIAFEQSEKEVQDLKQRTKEGIETARLNGKQIGLQQGSKLITKKSKEAKAVILKHSKDFEGTLSDADVMKLAGISRNSFYKYKRELRAKYFNDTNDTDEDMNREY